MINLDFRMPTSFIDSVIYELLYDFSTKLVSREIEISHRLPRDDSETLHAAGQRLMNTPAKLLGALSDPRFLFRTFTAISNLSYEREESLGEIILAKAKHLNKDWEFTKFKDPVRLSEMRAVRKLLQIVSQSAHLHPEGASNIEGAYFLLCDTESIYGFGSLPPVSYHFYAQTFNIRFTNGKTWELLYNNIILMSVFNGNPGLPPKPIFQDQEFKGKIGSLCNNEAAKVLSNLAREASKQRHGTMLLISEKAGTEAERLSHQCIRIEPMRADTNLMKLVTAIDGAILLDTEGICHAIGVILDGPASTKEDTARGSRYNSAVRYVYGDHGRCLAVVVSADGTLDFV